MLRFVYFENFKIKKVAKLNIFNYIEVFCNRVSDFSGAAHRLYIKNYKENKLFGGNYEKNHFTIFIFCEWPFI